MRVILLGSSGSPYIGELVSVLSAHGLHVDVLDVSGNRVVCGGREGRIVPQALHRLPRLGAHLCVLGAGRFLRRHRYDLCGIHYNSRVYGHRLFREVTSVAPRLVVSVWGSDFDGCSAATLARQRPLYERAAAITFNNDCVRRRFAAYYQMAAEKLLIVRFGIGLLEEIDRARKEWPRAGQAKEALGLPPNAVTIACGYNGRPAQNHERIFEAIRRARPRLTRPLFVIAPMTYGAPAGYRDRVLQALRSAGIEHRIFDSRLSARKMALVRLASDAMIHMQDHDSFSAAMQEHLYAGSVVINGAWLTYDVLVDRGVYYRSAADFGALADLLPDVVNRIEDHRRLCAANPPAIWQLSSWECNAPAWVQLYRGRPTGGGSANPSETGLAPPRRSVEEVST